MPDGLTMYFARGNEGAFYYFRMYQATRATVSDPFSQVTEISTLNNSGGHILFPWVSSDNLRMYYQTTQTGISKIRYTSRASTSAPWMPGTEISQIDALGNVSSISLSSDEHTALIAVNNGSTFLTYIATRPDKNSSFSTPTAVAAMNTSYSADPFLMPDGLSAYFVSGSGGQLYKTTRATLSDAFGNVEMIPGFDKIRTPSVTADGMTMYWAKAAFDQRGLPIHDIYVSHYIPEPATMMLLGLLRVTSASQKSLAIRTLYFKKGKGGHIWSPFFCSILALAKECHPCENGGGDQPIHNLFFCWRLKADGSCPHRMKCACTILLNPKKIKKFHFL